MVLNNRIIREFFENKVKYLGLIILIIMSSMTIVGFTDSTESIMDTASRYFKSNNCEDGNFILKDKINNSTLNKLKKLGIDIEESFYSDCKTYSGQTIRIYKERKKINKIWIIGGNELNNNNDILLDDKISKIQGYSIGNTLKIGDEKYNITGYAVVPDYTFIKRNVGDLFSDPRKFGIAFVNEENFNKLNEKIYSYSFKVNGASIDDVKSILQKNTQLNSFIKADDNARITGYAEDLKINTYVAVLIGCLLCGMIGFVISMMIVSIIDKESPIIGALYSLGYVKSEILKHFMLLPIIIVSIGSVIGTVLGFILQGPLGEASSGMYSLPEIKTSFSAYIIFMGIMFPIIIVIVVNYFILSKRLNSTPLQLLRKEKRQSKLKTFKIEGFDFQTRFKVIQIVREIGSNIMLCMGVLFSMFILILGLGMNSSVKAYIENIKEDISVNYTYLLKIPVNINESNKTEKSYIKSLAMYYKLMDCNMNVTLQGIKEDTCFYDFKISDNDNCVYISNSVAEKFNIHIGDFLDLKDTENNRVYRVKVGGTVDYSVGLYMFMNIKSMNKLMDNDSSNYNSFLSKEKLNINNDYIFSTITSEDIISNAESTLEMMLPMEVLIICIATILFILIMYLLLKLMIDKNIVGISLIKVFGFNRREVSRLYIGSGLYTIIICLTFGMPISMKIYKIVWPNLISNIEAYMFVKMSPQYYIYVVVITLSSYFVSTILLKNYINKISLSEALKNRE